MSMRMMVFLVDGADIKGVFGCNDAELLDDLLPWDGGRMPPDELDEEFADVIEDACPGFTHADALRDIVAGRVSRPEAGLRYANAFSQVCEAYGEWVQNHFHRCNVRARRTTWEIARCGAVIR